MKNIKLWVKQNSPEILLASAIINSATSIVFGCIATKKLQTALKPYKLNIAKVHKEIDNINASSIKTIDEKEVALKEANNKLKKWRRKEALKVIYYYTPCLITFGLSTASMFGSHKILKGRNVALAAALTTLKSGYDAYRQRVRDKIGEEAEKALFENRNTKELTNKSNKDSSKELDKKSLANTHTDCDFGVIWGIGNSNFDKVNPGLNITFLNQVEQYCNRKLQAQGYLFLCDVYDELGYNADLLGERKLMASRVLGWIYDPSDKTRDSYISFGINKPNNTLTEAAKRMQSGLEDSIWLEFNVDGDILTGNKGAATFMKYAIEKGK